MKIVVLFVMFLSTISCTSTSTEPKPQETAHPLDKEGWKFVWGDEFDGTQLDYANKWNVEIAGSGFGNNEAQYYTARQQNLRIEDGKLIIQAHRETFTGPDGVTRNYTSGKLMSKRPGFLYGRFEIRAKLPRGRGTWPAIWMLPDQQTFGTQYWPDNGEIDIMEHVGFDEGRIHASVHTRDFNHRQNNHPTASYLLPSVTQQFHVYAIEWSENKIDFFVDNMKYFTYERNNQNWTGYPFIKPFHLIVNLAIGGTWGGAQGIDDSAFPMQMEVDYVRVYRKAN
ncbi:MAG: family 16 glycosylhydrolase [Chloroherpetonaceae bacterium]